MEMADVAHDLDPEVCFVRDSFLEIDDCDAGRQDNGVVQQHKGTDPDEMAEDDSGHPEMTEKDECVFFVTVGFGTVEKVHRAGRGERICCFGKGFAA